jgi:AbiV family abortive infection protein
MSDERRELMRKLRSLDSTGLDQFDSGAISDEEIARGMHLSFVNAQNLLEDAELLYKNERFGRAQALLVLALEEIGRIPMLLNAMVIESSDEKQWAAFWKQVRQHCAKQGVWVAYGKGLAAAGHPDAKFFGPRLPEGDERLIDRLKQCGFYLSFFERSFLLPNLFARSRRKQLLEFFDFVRNRLQGLSTLHANFGDSLRLALRFREQINKLTPDERKAEAMELFGTVQQRKSTTVH